MTLPRVVTLTTLKGGCGKSTVAVALAVHWHEAGHHPALVDADPQQSLIQWSALNELDLPVVGNTTEQVGNTIAKLERQYRPVVVDTAGFLNRTTIEATAAADLVLVPVKPSPLDVTVAHDTAHLVRQTNDTAERRQRQVMIRVLITQTTPHCVIAQHIRGQMIAIGLDPFLTELANRVAYGESALSGLTPTLTDPKGAAALDIAALAAEIEGLHRAADLSHVIVMGEVRHGEEASAHAQA